MASDTATSHQATLQCDRHGCPAAWQQQVELHGQDFKFCMHHFNELEPVFIGMVERELAVT